MRVEPYLMLNGRCEEALAFYERALGAKPTMVMRFSESPEPSQMPLPDGWGNKIMHSGFMVGDTLVMASDGWGEPPAPMTGVTLSISADSEAQAHRLFDAMADGGQVTMPLAKTFWSPCFGMLTDRFGVAWMIGTDGPAP